MSHTQPDPAVSRTPIARDAQDLPTCCVLCSHNCGLRVDVQDGRMVAVRADPSNPISRGYVCNKGFSVPHYAHHRQRVEHPLRRRPDGSFERVGWDEAIADIARRLDVIRANHSPRAIGLVGIGGQANHMDAPYGLGFLRGLGSRRWFNAFAQEKTQHALVDKWMFSSTPSAFLHPDDHHTNYLLILGSNPKISNRGHNPTETLRALKKDAARTVVVVDPRRTETARGADLHLQIRPGADVYLLLGLAARIVSRGLFDARSAARTVGFQVLCDALRDVDEGAMAERCGLDPQVLARVADDFAAAPSASILCDLGIEQVPFSTLNAYLIRVLLVLTDNLGRRGGNVFYQGINPPDPRRQEQGQVEQALVSGIPAIRALGSYGMFSPSLVPEEVLCDHPQRLRALVVEGSNPLLSYADTGRWREALARLDLLVVIDPAMTETARVADYVLPTPVGYEKWEISTFPKQFPEIHTQVRPPVIPGPPDALPEPEIYARLAEAMDLFGRPPLPMRLLGRLAHRPRARHGLLLSAFAAAGLSRRGTGRGQQNRVIFWLYRTLGPHLPAPSLAVVWLLCFKNAVRRRAAVLRVLGDSWRRRTPFGLADELFRRILAHPEGVELARLDASSNLEDHLGHPDGRIRIAPEPMLGELARALAAPPADQDFPLVLSAGLRTPWTANTIHRDPAWRKGRGPHCALHISASDAERLGIEDGQTVRLETARGQAALPARVDVHLDAGFVFVPNGFGALKTDAEGREVPDGLNLNELTAADDRDPFTGCPHHKHVRCRVAPLPASVSRAPAQTGARS